VGLTHPASARYETSDGSPNRQAHHAEVLTLTGDSYRTRQRRELLSKDNRVSRD
jgi:hypothetical protein